MSLSQRVKILQQQQQHTHTAASAATQEVDFENKLSVKDEHSMNLSFVRYSNGRYVYQSANDMKTEQITDNDELALQILTTLVDWDVLKSQFAKRGVDVSGPDKTVIITRALRLYASRPDSSGTSGAL